MKQRRDRQNGNRDERKGTTKLNGKRLLLNGCYYCENLTGIYIRNTRFMNEPTTIDLYCFAQ